MDGQGSKLTVIRQKVCGPNELKDKSPRVIMSERIKVDDPKMSKWTKSIEVVQRYGPKVLKWMV